jgi:DNA-binding LytR/AlgR family response regulator
MNPFPVVVVAESDGVAMREIVSQLATVIPKVDIVCCPNGLDAWQALTSRHVDLLILNLRLSAIPSFVLIDKLIAENWSVPNVMLTGHLDSFLHHVLNQSPLPFLNQPVIQEQLAKLLQNIQRTDAHKKQLVDFLKAFESRLPWQDKMRWLRLHGNDGECVKHVDDIFYIRDDPHSGKIIVGTDHGEHWLLEIFRSLILRLDAERFWRVNRHTVINAAHIVAAGHDFFGRQWLELRDGARLKVGSAYERFDVTKALTARHQHLIS